MQHLIIVAHPVPDSFTMALARAYAIELEAQGHTAHLRDLYRIGFDPILSAHELVSAESGHPASPDVAAAQKDILAADALTVIYPLWWMSMPAILKGYIDRVFARGFAYESGPDGVRGLIAGKQCVLVTVSGAPLWRLAEAGRWDAAQVLQDTHIFRSVGFQLLEHLHFDGVVPHLGAAMVEGHIDRVRACARQHFSGSGSAA